MGGVVAMTLSMFQTKHTFFLFFLFLIFFMLYGHSYVHAEEKTYLVKGHAQQNIYKKIDYLENLDISIVTIDTTNNRAPLGISKDTLHEDSKRYPMWTTLNTDGPITKWHIDNYSLPQSSLLEPVQSSTVAIIDTGITMHEQLKPYVLPGKNVIMDSADVTDNHGHGTELAGVIADVAKDLPVYILPIKASANGYFKLSDIVNGIDYAIEQQVDIINLSFGASFPDAIEEMAVQTAIDNGIIVVSSSGNSGFEEYCYPASYENVISVGSTNEQELRSNFSTYNDLVDFVAPGESIVTLSHFLDQPLTNVDGTSFSSAYFSGILAVMETLYEPTNLIQDLTPYTKDLGLLGRDIEYGEGLVQPLKALTKLRGSANDVIQTTEKKKTWTVTFSKPFDVTTVTSKSIKIVDNLLQPVETTITISEDSNCIFITPTQELAAGDYWLIVKSDILSQTDEQLEEAEYVKFSITS